jgi:hypothetical protein
MLDFLDLPPWLVNQGEIQKKIVEEKDVCIGADLTISHQEIPQGNSALDSNVESQIPLTPLYLQHQHPFILYGIWNWTYQAQNLKFLLILALERCLTVCILLGRSVSPSLFIKIPISISTPTHTGHNSSFMLLLGVRYCLLLVVKKV